MNKLEIMYNNKEFLNLVIMYILKKEILFNNIKTYILNMRIDNAHIFFFQWVYYQLTP